MKIFTLFTKSRRPSPLFVVWSFITFFVISISAIPLHAQEDPDADGPPPNFLQATYGFFRVMGAIPCRAFIGDQSDLGDDALLGVRKEQEWVSWVGPKHLVSGTPLGKPQKPKPAGRGSIARTDFTVGLTRNTRSSTRFGRSNDDPAPYPPGSTTPHDFFQYSIEHQNYESPEGKFFILPVIDNSTGLVGGWVVFSAEKTKIALGHIVDNRPASISWNFPGTNGLPSTFEELKMLQDKGRRREKFWSGTRNKTRELQTPYRDLLNQDPHTKLHYVPLKLGHPRIEDRDDPRYWEQFDTNYPQDSSPGLSSLKTHAVIEETCHVKSIYTPEHFTTFASHFTGNLITECSESKIRSKLNDPENALAPWCIAELIHKGKVEIEINNALQSALRWLPIRGTAERIVDCQENGSAHCWSMAAASFVGDAALLAPFIRVAAGGAAAFGPARITEEARKRITHLVPEKVREVMTKVHGYSVSDVLGVVSAPLDALNAGFDAATGNVAGVIGNLVGGGVNVVFMKPVPMPLPAGASPNAVSNVRAPSIGVARGKTIANNSDCPLPVTVAASSENTICQTKTARQVIEEAVKDKEDVIAEFGSNFRDAVNENTKYYRVINNDELSKLRHEGRLLNFLVEDVLEGGLPNVRVKNPNAGPWIDEMIALGHPEDFIINELTQHQTRILNNIAEVVDGRLRLKRDFGTTSAGGVAPVIPSSAFGPARSYLEGLRNSSNKYMVKFKNGIKKMTGNPSIDETEYLIPIGYKLDDVEYIVRYKTDNPLDTAGEFVYTSANGWNNNISVCYSTKKTQQIDSQEVLGQRLEILVKTLRKRSLKLEIDLGPDFNSFYEGSKALGKRAQVPRAYVDYGDLVNAEQEMRRYFEILFSSP